MGARADRMLLGVRPEDIETEGGSANADVRLVEENGADKILVIHWAGADFHVLTHRRAAFKPGDAIRPALAPAKAILWPAT